MSGMGWASARQFALLLLPCLLLLLPPGSSAEQQCFEQQYSNRIANFGSLHVIKRVGVISPLGAFYLAHFIDADEAEESSKFNGGEERHAARRENGEKLVIYSGHSAHSLEWAQPNLLASVLRLEPILGDQLADSTRGSISPVLLVTACPAARAGPVALSGPSFTIRPDQLGIVPAYENELTINFRTFENGLFFYSMADHGDHLIGEVWRIQLSGGLALDDGNWHELRWSHRFDTAELFVDGVKANGTDIVGLYRKLDLHFEVEIGGRPEELGDEQVVEFTLQHGFHGCLARMELNGANLLEAAPVELKSCQMPRPQLVALGPGTALQIPYSFLPFALDFHVLPRPGPLLSILDSANSTLLQVRLLDGPQLSIGTNLGGEVPKTISLGIHPSGWHSLAIKLRAESLDLELDGLTVFWVQGHQARRIGTTMQTFLLSSIGCYRSTTIDLVQGMPLGPEFHRDQCPLIERCSPNPCANEGKCVQTGFFAFQCECPKNYSGRLCQISKLPHSCEQHFFASTLRGKGGGKAAVEQLLIDLDGGGPLKPFRVECRRRSGGKGGKRRKGKGKQGQGEGESEELGVFSLLAHDAPSNGIVVKGVTEPGAVRRVLDYGLGQNELERFMGLFEQCQQRMRFECANGQRLMSYGGENRPSTWYATRNGQHGLQWGEAPPFSRLCSCALNDTCAEQNRQCNCDSGRLAAVDDGLNTHLQLLPVLQLFIGGGTELHSKANVSIGPLECSGRYVFDAITFTDRNQRLLASMNFPSSSTFHVSLMLRLSHSHLTVFTFASSNHERWFQLFVREGRLVGQIVYAGISHELVSDVPVDDDRWHTVHWEVDEQSMRLQVDRSEKTVFSASVPPRASTLIIGSRTGKDRSGFAGQMRNFILNGEELNLGQLAQKALGNGVQAGEWGACVGEQTCRNEAKCVEFYDGFKCNCSKTPFAGETCEDEVGMWVPLGSELKIAWQHPAQIANCFRVNIHTSSAQVNLIRARALFAESQFNLSVDGNSHLNVFIFDGFFFTQNVTFDGLYLADNKSKDIRFCANSTEFLLTVNGEKAVSVEGNFTFFNALNVWHFVDHNFAGCISRLMIGEAFPLKNPRESRLIHSGKIRFGSCPFDNLEHRKAKGRVEGVFGSQQLASGGAPTSADEIHATSLVKSQRRLLFITPAIGLLSALCILISLCVFILYVQRRPDGVYKTHEKNGVPGGSYGGVPPLLLENGNGIGTGIGATNSLTRPLRLPKQPSPRRGKAENAMAQEKHAESMSLSNKEYFC